MLAPRHRPSAGLVAALLAVIVVAACSTSTPNATPAAPSATSAPSKATGPKPVGSYPTGASWVGAQDMAGNAMEWVSDWLDEGYYRTSPGTDPTGPPTGTRKVEKGGWWGSNRFVARSAYRHYEDPPTYGDEHIGLRVASQ